MTEEQQQQLLEENARLRSLVQKQAEQIALMQQTIEALTRRVFGVKSETLDPGQLELLLDPDALKKQAAADGHGDVPAAEVVKPRRKKQMRQPRIPEHLPVEEEVLEPVEVQADPAAWRRMGEEVREQLDYRPGRFLRRRLVRPKYVRRDDPLGRPVIAPLPPCLQERCNATPGLIAEVVTARFAHHQPYYRQSEIFRAQGVNLDRKTLCGWALLASDWLSAIYREIEEEHRQATYLQLDETPIGYLSPGSGKARTGYLWTSAIPGGSVLYRWRKGRDHGGIAELLDQAEGTAPALRVIQCDGYSAYSAWARDKPHITLAGCHAHVRRKFHEARDQNPKLIGWILRQLGHLYQIEKHLRESRASPVLREAMRASQSAPIHRRLKHLFERLSRRRAILPKSLLGKAVNYALNQWRHLEPWLTDGRIEIDNNLCENAIRPTKLGAKNWLFIGREAAGGKSAVLYTIVENCRRLKIDPRFYLEDALTRLPLMKNHEVGQLTPANWQKAKQSEAASAVRAA